MPRIPAICKTCNTIFPTPFDLKPNASGTLIGCTSTCPKCGKPAQILDGVYKGLDNAVAVLLQHPNPELLSRFIGVLREARTLAARARVHRVGRPVKKKRHPSRRWQRDEPADKTQDATQEAKDIADKIRRATPELQSIGDCIPKTRNELYAFAAILIAVATLLVATVRSCYPEKNQPTIEVKQDIDINIDIAIDVHQYIENSLNLIYRNEAPE